MRQIEGLARDLGCPTEYLTVAALDEIADAHQGVILYTGDVVVEVSLDSVLARGGTGRLFLVLDGVTDPHNLGACIRSAATMGVSAVIAPVNASASLTPVARKAACGGADLVPYLRVVNVARCLEQLKRAGFWVMGTALDGENPLHSHDLTGDLVIVMGSEGSGLRRITRDHCDYVAKIPMVDAALGFNVSVATGITLYEVQRQRGLAS